MIFMALLAIKHEAIVRAVGEGLAPFIGLGIAAIVWILFLMLYDRIPKRLLFAFGIIGWILTLSLGYWYLNYGSPA